MYTPGKWDEVVNTMKTGDFARKKLRDFSRLFFSSAAFVTPDSQGRILLPEKLRILAALKKDVIFVGVQDRVEIWNAETWKRFESGLEDDFETMAEEISGELF
jgi:MraZ protein